MALDDENLQEELKNYQKAIKAEYELSKNGVPENVEELTRDFFKTQAAAAAAQVVWLANNAHSESTRLSAAKAVIEYAINDAKDDGDPIKNLIKELQAPSTTK
jgi:hypothetical protein